MIRLGDVEIVAVPDAVGVVAGLDELYPGVSLHEWAPYRQLYPELFSGSAWRVPCNSFLIRTKKETVLVDTGLGNHEFFEEAETRGGLLDNVSPAEVDTVFITHVHVDHVGWNPEFDRARFVLHRDAVAAAHDRAERPHIWRCVLPLIETGRVDEIEGGAEIAPGIVALELAGHDPGHVGLRIGSEAILIADAIPHPAQLDNPDWPFWADADPELAAQTRRELVEEVADTGTLVVSSHYPRSGIGRVSHHGGRVVWTEAA